ncbi:hypothetical protein AB1Y20_023519 [Prymnesium parvum]|uniref:NADH-cytochrome b5 reductase n=1 Tax=Prymnesium parvum TaxID=97485 RepID=A0AB34JGH1_PRYPA
MAKPRPPAPPPAPAPDAIAQLAQKAKETPVLLAVLLVVGALLYTLLKGKKKAGGKFLNKQRQSLVLGERLDLSHDTVRFRFLLPKATPVLGLPVGKHFKLYCPAPKGKVKGQWNGREDPEEGSDEIERKYTPCTSDDEVGYVDLVVKVYKGGVLDRFPDGGKMSQYLSTLKVGDSISISGPWGMNEYVGKGKFLIGKREVHCKKLGMLAGGTGITPMLQVMSAILKDAADPTKISLLFANQSEDDILVRHMLEELQNKHPDRLKVWYTVDRPPPRWKYSSGFITATMISDHLPPPGDDTLVLMCGPPPMVKFACLENLNQLGYAKENLVVF